MKFYSAVLAFSVINCSLGTALYLCKSTPPGPEAFDAKNDAEALKEADEEGIIDILGYRDTSQRLEISSYFKSKFGEEGFINLEKKLTGHFKDLVIAMLTPRNDFRVQEIHRAIKDPNTEETTFVEILAPLRTTAKFNLVTSYEEKYGDPLEEAIKKNHSEEFNKLAAFLCSTNREEVRYSDLELPIIKTDAQNLMAEGEGKWSQPHSEFHSLFGTKGYGQLRKLFEEYEKLAGHPIEDDIRKEFQGSLQKGYLEIVKSIRNNDAYLAERLHNSLTGKVTDHRTIIRILGVENAVVLDSIKVEYNKLYGHTLQSKIKKQGDISGHYKNLLLVILTCH